jgi:hypothetical protein
MFYYLLRIFNHKEGPNLLIITSDLPHILMSWVE